MSIVEAQFIDWLRNALPAHPLLRLGVGDDAALVAGTGDWLVTVDLLTAGVDFVPGEVDLRLVGRKALAVNLSDIAAMAGTPTAAVVALALPREDALNMAKRLYEGILPLAEEFHVALAGGDTNTWDGPLVVAVTLHGHVSSRGPLLRSQAQPGDAIVVTGHFGGSILRRQFSFVPRIREALTLHERYDLHAGIDVSDGLALDLSRLAQASRCGAVVELDCVPIHADARELSRQDGRSPLEHALGDGEDFELVLAVPESDAERMMSEAPLAVPLTRIGRFVTEPGLWTRTPTGMLRPLAPSGYLHGEAG